MLYDGALKRTRFAPLLMGECRILNVLLGMSLYVRPVGQMSRLLIALGIGDLHRRRDDLRPNRCRISSRSRLVSGFAVLLAGMALLAAYAVAHANRPPLEVPSNGWYMLWAAFALITARRCVMAIFEPTPPRVQAAVRHCVQSIIVLDAAVCVGYAGPYWGFAVLALLFPTLLLTTLAQRDLTLQ